MNPPNRPALVAVADARARLLATINPVGPTPRPVRESCGRLLAEDLRAPHALPPQAVALRDGWAVTADDLVGASAYSPVMLAQPPAWIEAGRSLPTGSDALLPRDAVSTLAGSCEITLPVGPGEGIRRAGDDAEAGTVLRARGERLRPVDVAIAIEAGQEHCHVSDLTVRLIAPAGHATAGFMAQFIEGRGASVERVAASSRDPAGLAPLLPGAAFAIMIGGNDLARQGGSAEALARAGQVLFHGLALRPGENTGCGFVDGAPVLLVSDRLDEALGAALMLVAPVLDALIGTAPSWPLMSGRLTRKLPSTIGVTEIALLRKTPAGLEPLAIADLTLAAIARADEWLAIPPESEGFAAGESVEAFVL